jgi:tetratricopeptide (TPR) repeat protein
MKKYLTFILLAVATTFAAAAPRASAQTEGRVAWQVVRYDINASVTGASHADRALAARVTVNVTNVGGAAGRQLTARINPDAVVSAVSVAGGAAQFTTRVDGQTKLMMVSVTLPAAVAPGGTASVLFDYRLPVAENTGVAAVSVEGSQFLPLAYWYPTPNTPVAPRGADYAPYGLTVAGSETVISAGRASAGNSFDEPLYAQPFFLTGRWETVEGAGEARGVSAHLEPGPTADERKRAEALVALAAAARTFYAGLLGPAPDVPVRLVAVRRGAGFDQAGTLLLDGAVFRRTKTDSVTAMAVAEAVARLWVGGATAVHGEGAGTLREGLVRFLATQFIEKQFGREAADSERARIAHAYAAVAGRDAPLAQSTPAFDTYFTSAANKGALVWRLLMERGVGREQFLAALKREFEPGRRVSLAGLRASLGERGSEALAALFAGLFDRPTDTDLLIGKARLDAGEWQATVRNLGSIPADINVAATTDRGERLIARVSVPAKGDAVARFKSSAPVTFVEADPERLYPQIDFTRDVAPWPASPPDQMLSEARAQVTPQPARAEQLARELLARAPHLQEARIVLGRALLEQRKLPDAERVFRAALELPLPTPATLAWANVGLGEVALRGGQAAEAARRFDEAVRAEAEYASNLAARAARIRAEAAAGTPPPADDAVRAAVTQLDATIRSGRKAELEAAILPGELSNFSKGIIGSQPEVWQTKVLRTEARGSGRAAADVEVTTRTLGRDQAGTAVLVFARTPAGLRLANIELFEVR